MRAHFYSGRESTNMRAHFYSVRELYKHTMAHIPYTKLKMDTLL